MRSAEGDPFCLRRAECERGSEGGSRREGPVRRERRKRELPPAGHKTLRTEVESDDTLTGATNYQPLTLEGTWAKSVPVW